VEDTVPGPEGGLIAWLGTAEDPESLGGKGASLDRLVRMGFRVPLGFCLTTAAFLAQRAALEGRVAASGAQPASLDRLASEPLLPAINAALLAALERLVRELRSSGIDDPRLAVRSSAVGEDGTVASYAGLHETELDLRPDGVAGAVARCWASLGSPAAVAYRRRRGLPQDGAAMAVVVQALVPADAAAVGFTRHPVTGRADQLVVTAVRGLGDAMVSGTVTPDTYTIDRVSGATVEHEPGEDPQGPALNPDELDELVSLMLAVEEGFGAAVDIEAARAGGVWYLLQARPITAMALA
jgi:phosphoenolpyruvate synthase/pyruvate phosphate dikinase